MGRVATDAPSAEAAEMGCSRRAAHSAGFQRRRPQTVRNLSPPLVIVITVSTAVWGRLASRRAIAR